MRTSTTTFTPASAKTEAERSASRKSEWATTRTIVLDGDGGPYTADMTCGPGGFTCEWSPHPPIRNGRGLLKKKAVKLYQRVRNELIQQTANHIGGAVLLIE